jgi:hypothetical protein
LESNNNLQNSLVENVEETDQKASTSIPLIPTEENRIPFKNDAIDQISINDMPDRKLIISEQANVEEEFTMDPDKYLKSPLPITIDSQQSQVTLMDGENKTFDRKLKSFGSPLLLNPDDEITVIGPNILSNAVNSPSVAPMLPKYLEVPCSVIDKIFDISTSCGAEAVKLFVLQPMKVSVYPAKLAYHVFFSAT